jgi:hypothetical protein
MRCALMLSLVVLLCGCQPIEHLPIEQRQHVAIHEVAGKDRAVIFTAARAWFAKAFRDSKAVLEVQDKETGQLMGKGVTMNAIGGTLGGGIRVLITIDTKDGKYRTTMEPMNFVSVSGSERGLEQYELADALAACKRLDDDLAAFIAKPPTDF